MAPYMAADCKTLRFCNSLRNELSDTTRARHRIQPG
jgi:hypothetical protein